MDVTELTSVFCDRPQNFGWFLGAGASRTAGLPTATDIIWDLKCRYFCQQENEDITRQDVQIGAVRSRIQSYMLSKGFPDEWAAEEYSLYFEKIFGGDRERQRAYLTKILAEDKATLTVGNRVFGGMLASGLCRAAFTTNFDSIVEKAVAEVSGTSLAAFHIEGASAAVAALNNDEFPLYCKLHGDFRYDSVKNLADDLATQNENLAQAFKIASSRFGFVVAGFSGRDASIMALFNEAIEAPNAFPHGLYWTGVKGAAVPAAVEQLLVAASAKGIKAAYVEVETFDALMLRLWRNISERPPELDRKVHKSHKSEVSIPLPKRGTGKPLLRLNALPVTQLPGECQSVTFKTAKGWRELRDAQRKSEGSLIFARGESVLAWGSEKELRNQFSDISAVDAFDLAPALVALDDNTHIKGLLEEALAFAIIRGKPLLARTIGPNAFVIADAHATDQSSFEALRRATGGAHGQIPGLFAPVDDFHTQPERVFWAEAARVSLDVKDGRCWLILDPDIWIWPARARSVAATFMEQRRSNRYNNRYNDIFDAWARIIVGTDARNVSVTLSTFESGSARENPSFSIGTGSAFSQRLKS